MAREGTTRDIASRFTGSSVPQPEMSFQQSYGAQKEQQRKASLDAKTLQSLYRGQGDDVLSTHERNLRLEAAARRRAEQEALDNLHRYRGLGGFSLILAIERSRLGLTLTAEEQELIELAAAEDTTGLQMSFSSDEVANARARALAEAGEEGRGAASMRTPSEAQLVADGRSPSGARHGTGRGSPGGSEGSFSSAEEADDNDLLAPAAPAPAPAPAPPTAAEADRLFALIQSILRAAGKPLTLSDISAAIGERTGHSWGAFWEGRHGPLLQFLKAQIAASGLTSGLQLAGNKWLMLAGMAPPPEEAVAVSPHMTRQLAEQRRAHANLHDLNPQLPPMLPGGMGAASSYYAAGTTYAYSSNAGGADWHPFGSAEGGGLDELFDPLATATRLQKEREAAAAAARRQSEDTLARIRREKEEEAAMRELQRQRQEQDDAALAREIAALEATALRDQQAAAARGSTALTLPGHHAGTMSTASYGSAGGYGPYAAAPPPPLPARRVPGMDSSSAVYATSMQHFTSASAAPAMPTMAAMPAMMPYSGGGSMRQSYSAYASGSQQQQLAQPIPQPQSQSHMSRSSLDVETFARNTVDRGVCDGDENLTWRDFDLLFRPMLAHGFTLIKHGRSGLPKRRRFWMNAGMNRLYWDTTRVVDVLKSGERHLNIADVTQLIDGIGTELLRRKADRGEIGSEGRFFSLVTHERTYDFEAASVAQRKVLVRAFSFLVNHLSRPRQLPVGRVMAVAGGGSGGGNLPGPRPGSGAGGSTGGSGGGRYLADRPATREYDKGYDEERYGGYRDYR